MKKGLTELVFIIDRSGSMSGLEKDTIGGFNSLIKKQRGEDGEAYVSAVLFSDSSEVLYDREDISKVEPMTEKQYVTMGCTALLDAVGGSIHHIGNIHKYAREEDVPEKTLFVIITDGMENASRKYTYDRVKSSIDAKRESGWEFMFIGANIDVAATAGRMGIDRDMAVEYKCDEAGTQTVYEAVCCAVSDMRSPAAGMMGRKRSSWRDMIEKDRKSRS